MSEGWGVVELQVNLSLDSGQAISHGFNGRGIGVLCAWVLQDGRTSYEHISTSLKYSKERED